MKKHPFRSALTLTSAASLAVLLTAPVQAFEFQSKSGEVTGSWDTTVAYSQAWRIQSPDCRLIANANGGCGRSPNIDDGDLNFGTDLYSRAFKAVTEISMNYKNVGAFLRGSAFWDPADTEAKAAPIARRCRAPAMTWSANIRVCWMHSFTQV